MTNGQTPLPDEELSMLPQSIEAFAALVGRCNAEYDQCSAKLSEIERLRKDLLHFMVLFGQDYSARCKWGTQLRRCLIDRRYYKDRMEQLYPVTILSRGKHHLYADLRCAGGQAKQVAAKHAARIYHPRVLTVDDDSDDDIDSEQQIPLPTACSG